jgi:ubiquinone/menaquinone biosynthesis C-methylase UbiE
MRGHQPFDKDIQHHGAYLYSGEGAPFSAVLANAAQSRLIHRSVNSYSKTILDVGCGDGKYTVELAELGSVESVLGIDPSEKAIAMANSSYETNSKVEFSSQNLSDLILLGRKFDLAIVRGVLHHAHEPKSLIRDLGLLAEEVIVLEPNGLNVVLKVIEKTSKYHIEHGERSFPFWRISSWLRDGGFVLKKKYAGVLVPFFCPRILALFLNKLQPIAENLFVLRWLICGTQVFVAKRK